MGQGQRERVPAMTVLSVVGRQVNGSTFIQGMACRGRQPALAGTGQRSDDVQKRLVMVIRMLHARDVALDGNLVQGVGE
jgi:hypothetical protein